MLFPLLLSLLQVVAIPASEPSLQQSKQQARYYINNIKQERNIDENIWSLAIVTSEHPEVRNFVEKKIKAEYSDQNTLSAFDQIEGSFSEQLEKIVFAGGSANLFIALLLETESKTEREKLYRRYKSKYEPGSTRGINFTTIFQKIVKGNTINENDLTTKSYHLSHFFILFEYSDSLADDWLNNITKNWKVESDAPQNLHQTLANASLLRARYLKSQYSSIRPLYDPLLESKIIPNAAIKLRIYRYLDYSMFRLGYYDRSLKIVRNFTLPISNHLGLKATTLQLKQLQGVYLYSIGKIQAAEKAYQEVLTSVDKKNPEVRLSSLYNNLAVTYEKLGKYDEYLDLQFQALKIAERDSNYSHQIEIYRNLFIHYKRNNNKEDALQYLEEARQLAQKRGNANDLGTIYMSIGTTYRKFDQNFDKAYEYFEKSEKVLDPKNNSEDYIYLLRERALTFEKESKYKNALNQYDRILGLVTHKNRPNYLDALVNKAVVNIKMGNINNAGELITKFKSFDLTKLEFQQLIQAKTVEANYLDKTGNIEDALEILNPALEQIVVRAKNSADLETGFWHIEDEYLDAFELAVSIYKKNGNPEQAIQKLDQLKTINDASLYQNPLVKSSMLNESELTQYKKLTDQLDATRKKLLTAPENQKFEIRQSISQLKLKKRKLDKKLTQNIDSDPISIRQVQNKLSAHELVLHITELKDQYYIAHITRSSVRINTIPLDSTRRQLLSGAVQQVATHETNLDSLYKITEMLELRNISDRIQQVTVIPDSYFYQLPIDILPMTKPDKQYSYGQTKYLIEDFRTQYLTSLEDFQKDAESEKPARNKLNYVGYGVSNFSGYQDQSLVPLPFAQTEVANIAKNLSQMSGVKTYINEQSTKSAFTQTAPQAGIIHLATHSKVSQSDPMFSSVYMSKTTSTGADTTFDDRIFAYELFELNLNNEMIMLNSCESGSGSYIQGSGVMGFSRALQYAGARSLILNLWSVNDMLASDFAVHFYDQLNQGKSKAEALQNTKQYFLRTKNASPHFWGPYMLIGNADPIVEPHKETNMAMAGAFVFYFLLMMGLSYLTQAGYIFKGRKQKAA